MKARRFIRGSTGCFSWWECASNLRSWSFWPRRSFCSSWIKRQNPAIGSMSLLPKKRWYYKDHIRAKGDPKRTKTLLGKVKNMRKEYDFSKATKNPYASRLKRQITLRMDEGTISYFKKLAQEIGLPYQTLINLYLRDCAASHRKLALHWKPA